MTATRMLGFKIWPRAARTVLEKKADADATTDSDSAE